METIIPTLPVVAFLYKLIVGDQWYIGSSIQSIQDRMEKHYRQAKETPDRKLYKAVASVGGWCNVKVEILTTFSFTTKEDLWKGEDTHIKLDDPLCLNTIRAILTEEERMELKRETNCRCKKALYDERRKDPEWIAKERARANALYARKKSDPEWMKKKRESALASYHRRKSSSKVLSHEEHSNE